MDQTTPKKQPKDEVLQLDTQGNITAIEKDPNAVVYEFLKEKNYKMRFTAVESGGFIGDGFIMEEKPILKVVFYKI